MTEEWWEDKEGHKVLPIACEECGTYCAWVWEEERDKIPTMAIVCDMCAEVELKEASHVSRKAKQ